MPAVKAPFAPVPKRRRTGTGPNDSKSDDEAEVPSVHPKFGGDDSTLPSPTARLDSLVMLAVTDDDDDDDGPSVPSSAGSRKTKGKAPETPNRAMPPTPGNEDALHTSSEGTTGRARSTRGTHGAGGGDASAAGTRSQSAKSKGPPSFQPSPPVSPSPTTAAAAAAAAAAAGVDAKTWIQGDKPAPRTTRSRSDLKVAVGDAKGSDSDNGTPGGDAETPDEDTPGGSRRSMRRRSANPRFDSYCTATKGPFEVQQPPTKPSARKKVDLGIPGLSARDLDAKIERVLARLQAQLGQNHPEVGKVLLQVARLCYCGNRREKAEEYLMRSWDVFKCYTDKSTNLQQVFESFLELFEEYNCSAKALDSLRKEMYALSPTGMLSASLADGIASW